MRKTGSWISRKFPKLRLRALGMATIGDISTLEFIDLIKTLKSEGWHIADEYYNGGVLYHHSKIKLKRDSSKLNLQWNNKYGGRIEGAEDLIRDIASTHGFIAVGDRHWSQKDSIAA